MYRLEATALVPLPLDGECEATPCPVTVSISCLVQHVVPALRKVVAGQEAGHDMLDCYIVFEYWFCPADLLQHLSSAQSLHPRVRAADDTRWLCVLDMDAELAGGSLVADRAACQEGESVPAKHHLSLQLLGPCWLC